MSGKRRLGIGLIGTGFMARRMPLGSRLRHESSTCPSSWISYPFADVTQEGAEAARGQLGFRKATADWRELLTDPEIDIIDITTPNLLHKEMALAAIAHGKHVYCEKPLARRSPTAPRWSPPAKGRRRHQVGFNYLKNPLIFLARDIIESGEIGEIRSFRGIHAEDFMADESVPWGWRLDPRSGGGCARRHRQPHDRLHAPSRRADSVAYWQRPSSTFRSALSRAAPQRPGRSRSTTSRGPRPFRERRERKLRSELDRDRPQDAARFRDLRLQGKHRIHPGAAERDQGLLRRRRHQEPRPSGPIWAGPEHPPYGAFCVAPATRSASTS
ncbi:gfo/Idh/MocA family oxidoreductase [Sinorhizobium meliloti]|nr:gfo/Idh/MocA family oxidoreductase [Sinorhizobium meliloti]